MKLITDYASRITLLIVVASGLWPDPAPAQTPLVYNGVYADSNYSILPGYTIPSGQIIGVFTNQVVLPPTTNNIVVTNSGGAGITLFTNGFFRAVDRYGTVYLTGTNGLLAITQTSGPGVVISNGTVTADNLLLTNSTPSNALLTVAGAGTFLTVTSTVVTASNVNCQILAYNCSQAPNISGIVQLGPGCFQVGGTNNVVGPFISGGSVYGTGTGSVGGESNQNTAAFDAIQLGGSGNILNVASWSGELGGTMNNLAYDCDVLLGGKKNAIAAYYSGILGGSNNVISGNSIQSGIPTGMDNYDAVLGGANNQIGAGCNYCVAGGSFCGVSNTSCFVWSDYHGPIFFNTTGTNQFLVHAVGGVGINTNNPGTNSMYVSGNLAVDNLTVAGTNFWAELNAMTALQIYNLNLASNQLMVAVLSVSNSVVLASNLIPLILPVVTNNLIVTSNALAAQITGITAVKAFTATLSATYASLGIGFSAPLMPDGNYSVILTPADQNTADAAATLHWWISTKNNSGFTLAADYATNFDLNFDCIVKENSQ